MPKPELIAPKAQSTPASHTGFHSPSRAIPDDLLKEASRRLEIMSLLAAVLWSVASILWHLRLGSQSDQLRLSPYTSADNIAVVAVIGSLALYYYARTTKRDPQFILNLGLVYMVVTAADIGLITHWYTDPVD